MATLNQEALKELLGHLVFSHTFRSFDAKEAAEKALKELFHEDEPKQENTPAPQDAPASPPPTVYANGATTEQQ